MENEKILMNLIGNTKYEAFVSIKEYIENNYTLEQTFKEQNIKTKKWKYELKFVKGKKTFCGFYFCENCLGLLIIFGKDERNKVDAIRNELSKELLELYDNTEIYHDGKWFMLELEDLSFLESIKQLLCIKRKPNH